MRAHFVLLVPLLLGVANAEATGPTVVVGQIEQIEVFGFAHYKQFRSMYDHNTTQSFVLEIERNLAGPELPQRVIVHMEVEAVTHYSVTKEDTWFLLSPDEWQVGTALVMRLSSESRFGGPCFVKLPDEDYPGVVYFDPMVQRNRELSVYCGNIRDTWRALPNQKGQ